MKRLLAIAALCGAVLASTACSSDEDPEEHEERGGVAEAVDGEADTEDSNASDEDFGALSGEVQLQVGDCWGKDDEIELDPVPCEEPHIYEVVGIIEDWDREQYEGSFEAGVEGDEAMMDACKAAATAYFGYDPIDAGIMVDHDDPYFWGHEDLVFCSAHSGPDVEYVRDEVVGSFADRGWH